MNIIKLQTQYPNQMIDITENIEQIIPENFNWICIIYTPHTTCWITINEGYDPDVARDILSFLEEKIPKKWKFRHFEWNSDAHMKSSLIWVNQTIIIENWELLLWKWQKVFFCEFDWPRNRKVLVKLIW